MSKCKGKKNLTKLKDGILTNTQDPTYEKKVTLDEAWTYEYSNK